MGAVRHTKGAGNYSQCGALLLFQRIFFCLIWMSEVPRNCSQCGALLLFQFVFFCLIWMSECQDSAHMGKTNNKRARKGMKKAWEREGKARKSKEIAWKGEEEGKESFLYTSLASAGAHRGKNPWTSADLDTWGAYWRPDRGGKIPRNYS